MNKQIVLTTVLGCALALSASGSPVASADPFNETPRAISGDEWSGIQAQIAAARYEVSRPPAQPHLHVASNPRQRFELQFDARGLRVNPRPARAP